MKRDIIIYRIIIVLGIALLTVGYILKKDIILYMAAIGYLVAKGIKHWNNPPKN